MTRLGRRGFLASCASLPIVGALTRGADGSTARVFEVEEASAFHAPHLAAVLVPGTRLSVAGRRAGVYLMHQTHVIARLPDVIAARGALSDVRVERLERDRDGRLHIFVSAGVP